MDGIVNVLAEERSVRVGSCDLVVCDVKYALGEETHATLRVTGLVLIQSEDIIIFVLVVLNVAITVYVWSDEGRPSSKWVEIHPLPAVENSQEKVHMRKMNEGSPKGRILSSQKGIMIPHPSEGR